MQSNNKFIFYMNQLIGFIGLLYVARVNAVVSLGTVAENVRVPGSIIAYVFYNICYVVGMGFFMGGLFQFKAYRHNPEGVPISRSIVLIILGISIFCVPFVARHSESATAIHSTAQ